VIGWHRLSYIDGSWRVDAYNLKPTLTLALNDLPQKDLKTDP
jgi:hypothetical protein